MQPIIECWCCEKKRSEIFRRGKRRNCIYKCINFTTFVKAYRLTEGASCLIITEHRKTANQIAHTFEPETTLRRVFLTSSTISFYMSILSSCPICFSFSVLLSFYHHLLFYSSNVSLTKVCITYILVYCHSAKGRNSFTLISECILTHAYKHMYNILCVHTHVILGKFWTSGLNLNTTALDQVSYFPSALIHIFGNPTGYEMA